MAEEAKLCSRKFVLVIDNLIPRCSAFSIYDCTEQEVMAENNWQNLIGYERKKETESSLILVNFSLNDSNA